MEVLADYLPQIDDCHFGLFINWELLLITSKESLLVSETKQYTISAYKVLRDGCEI